MFMYNCFLVTPKRVPQLWISIMNKSFSKHSRGRANRLIASLSTRNKMIGDLVKIDAYNQQ